MGVAAIEWKRVCEDESCSKELVCECGNSSPLLENRNSNA